MKTRNPSSYPVIDRRQETSKESQTIKPKTQDSIYWLFCGGVAEISQGRCRNSTELPLHFFDQVCYMNDKTTGTVTASYSVLLHIFGTGFYRYKMFFRRLRRTVLNFNRKSLNRTSSNCDKLLEDRSPDILDADADIYQSAETPDVTGLRYTRRNALIPDNSSEVDIRIIRHLYLIKQLKMCGLI